MHFNFLYVKSLDGVLKATAQRGIESVSIQERTLTTTNKLVTVYECKMGMASGCGPRVFMRGLCTILSNAPQPLHVYKQYYISIVLNLLSHHDPQ